MKEAPEFPERPSLFTAQNIAIAVGLVLLIKAYGFYRQRQEKDSKFIQRISDRDFSEKVTNSSGLVLVDFWATWCGPCREIAPSINDLADKYAGKIQVYKMEIEKNPQTAKLMQVSGIPDVVLFKDGKPVDQKVGGYPIEVYENAIRSFL
jgi:thioredoxin 1